MAVLFRFMKRCPSDREDWCGDVWPKPNTAYQHHKLLPAVTQLAMICSVYQSILESSVRPAIWQLGPNWVIQQENDPKHNSKSTTEWLKQERWCDDPVKVQSSTWLKCCGRTLSKLCTTSMNWSDDVKKTEPKFLQKWRERLIRSYRKQLL